MPELLSALNVFKDELSSLRRSHAAAPLMTSGPRAQIGSAQTPICKPTSRFQPVLQSFTVASAMKFQTYQDKAEADCYLSEE